jgi:4-amino-4-deoxy-L-arabinose transferase-like glycosyltransferase
MTLTLKNFAKKCVQKKNWIYLISAALFLIYVVFYMGGLSSVPFHPDETTQIYMSSDVDTILHSFNVLFWQSNSADDLKQYYRELDAPLTRYLIGLGRLLTNSPSLNADWDWSKTWQQNQASGALPDPGLLLVSRASVAIFTLLALFFFFDLVRVLFNPYSALLAALILAFNPLVLIHSRRAMAESILIFSIIFFLWVVIRFPRRPLLVGAALAFAFCSKQSTAPLVIPGLIAVTAASFQQKRWLSFAKQSGFLILSFAVVTLLLNPFAWTDPLHAIPDAVRLRQEFTARQQGTISNASPEKNLDSLPDKLAGVIGALYFQPPAVADVANYMDDTSLAEKSYFSNPLNNLLHDPISSTLFFIAALLGCLLLSISLFRRSQLHINILISLLSFLSIALGLFFFVVIPFQRYYLPFIPFLSIMVSFALTTMPINRLSSKGTTP